ncbi:helix-turn-helix domain-containing protein [Methanomethylophilus alvi]|uniref:helix-turn-helix domain-containing protein n=1 Tax=Methanomethylophilus alvi TaxID=1291540 RepID=UPI0037DCEE0A
MSDELREKIAGEITLSEEPGRAIRKWREEFGISQYELADAMGVSHSVISDYESGRRKSPGVGVIRKMVDAFLRLDDANGSPVQSKYMPEKKMECILAMDEFPQGIDDDLFIRTIAGRNINPMKTPKKRIYGYTIVDSLKAILSLSSQDYMKIYGWSVERALIFTDVHYGRSPMVAIRAHPLTPAMVVYQKPDQTDSLAIKLAEKEGIPLVTTDLSVEKLIDKMNALKEGK